MVMGMIWVPGLQAQSDYGDYSGFGSASSQVLSTLSLGPPPDAELPGLANASATGDDNQQSDDEEALVWHANPTPGSSLPIYINGSVTGAAGYLNLWIDFNGNGLLTDPGERVVSNVRVATSGWFPFNIAIPKSATTGRGLGMRARITTTNNPGPTGASGFGEVEDHLITIDPVAQAYRFRAGDDDGDLQLDAFSELEPLQAYDIEYGTDAGILRDLDVTYLPGSETLMVDVSYEEKGNRQVEGMWLVLTPGGTPRTNNAAILYLDAFDPLVPKMTVYRYDATQSEGSWSSPGLLMLSSLPGRLNAGDVKHLSVHRDGGEVRIQFTLDTRQINNAALWPNHGLSADWLGLKCLSTAGVWLHGVDLMAPPTYDAAGKLAGWQTHPWPYGQVFFDSEFDSPLLTEPEPWRRDYGDFNGFFPASAEVDENLRLGFIVDAESVPQSNSDATADNEIDLDDEDGLLAMGVLQQGRTYTVDLPLSNTTDLEAFVSLWMDWNGDGRLNGVSEQVLTDRRVSPGTLDEFDDITFRVPNDAVVQTTLGLRLRLSSLPGAGPIGAHGEGEVEDSVFSIRESGTPSPLGIGNLVFTDGNENGQADPGEGLAGVVLHLFRDGQSPGVDLPLQMVKTQTQGDYRFNDLDPGRYYVHIPASQFKEGGALFTLQSIAEGLAGDDDVGEDGLNIGDPYWDGVSSRAVTMELGQAPTAATGETGFASDSDGANDASVDLTVDFGFQRPLGLGNMVFIDDDGNGRYDEGEGVENVRVELYRAGQDLWSELPIYVEMTDAKGRYFFAGLTSGEFIVYLPAGEFDYGGPLEGFVSLHGVEDGVDDDRGEDGLDDLEPFFNGIRSGVVTLTSGGQPTALTGETGAYSAADDEADDQSDLTVDFGFELYDSLTLGVGNAVYLDDNGNGIFEWWEGVDGVPVQLFRAGDDPLIDEPLMETVTGNGGYYLLTTTEPGAYQVHLPARAFALGEPLAGSISLPGAGGDFGADDDLDENGIDSVDPHLTGITSTPFVLMVDDEPVDWSSEFGQGFYQDTVDDDNYDLTIDFGFSVQVAVGNLVFEDRNGNGRADAGEGVAGVRVQLFAEWMDPYGDVPVAEVLTAGDGRFLFAGLLPGYYYLHIPAWEFESLGPLAGRISLPDASEGDDDLSEDGIDTLFPFFDGVSTQVFELAPGIIPVGESESGWMGDADDERDDQVDLTRDFGFARQALLGDCVFLDRNGDGLMDSDGVDDQPGTADDEKGLEGVQMEVWQPGDDGMIGGGDDVQIQSLAWTLPNGGYVLGELSPGAYYVKVPAMNFTSGGPLVQWPVVSQIAKALWYPEQDANRGVQLGGPGSDVYGPIVQIESGDERLDMDFGFRPTQQPISYAAWQQVYSDPSQNGPTQDFDGDLISNLEELAFGLAGNSGFRQREGTVGSRSPLRLQVDAATGRLDLCLDRVMALNGVTFQLEGIADLEASPDGWIEIDSIVPEVIGVSEGIEEICYRGLNQQAIFEGGNGAVRVRLILDADLNGTPEAGVATQALGWTTMALTPQLRTGSLPYAGSTVFSGRLTGTAGTQWTFANAVAAGQDTSSLIEPGVSYYLEGVSGPLAGHRLEVDEANTFGQHWAVHYNHPQSTLNGVTEAFVGESVRVRRHLTLAEVFPPSQHTATFSSNSADRLTVYDVALQAFGVYWLLNHPNGAYWVKLGDGSLSNRNAQVMDPMQGYFTQVRAPLVNAIYRGEVRDHPVVAKLIQEVQFVGCGWPVATSPNANGMKVEAGFKGSTSSAQSDQLLLWLADKTEGPGGYQTFYLLSSGSFRYWTEVGNGSVPNYDETRLFLPGRALFVRSRLGKADWQLPCPWTP